MARYLTGRAITLTHKFLDDETVISPSSVSVTITPLAGGANSTLPASLVNGFYSATFPPQVMGEYRVSWVGTTPAVTDVGTIDIVSNFLFTIPEARDSDRELKSQADYPAAEIAHYREVVEYEFEKITNRSFVPRRRTITIDAPGVDAVWLGIHDPKALVAISGPTGPLVVSDYRLDSDGILSGLESLPEGDSLSITVDYGFTEAPPDVKRAALIRLRYLLASETSGIPDRATMFQAANGGMFYLATAGRSGFQTGIPEVDHVLSQYTYSALYGVMAAF